MELTEKLITLRKQKGLTQLELAEALNVSRQAISKWESGVTVPSIDNLKYLSDFYSVSVDYLIGSREEDAGKTKKAFSVWTIIAAAAVITMILFALASSAYLKDKKENERNSLSIGSMSGEEVGSIPKTNFTIEW